MEEEGIGNTLKHFPGYGGSNDTHEGMAYDNRSYEIFEERDFLPFSAGIDAGADSIMVSHNIIMSMDSNYPASLSSEVHRILREDFNFDGVIISDDLYMGAIEQYANGENVAVQAILAGNDVICCADYEGSAKAIIEAIDNGVIPISQIDESVLRILTWKRKLGIIVAL